MRVKTADELLMDNVGNKADEAKWFEKVNKELFNPLYLRIKTISPAINMENRARKISCRTETGSPKKFLEVLCNKKNLVVRFYSAKNKKRIYPEGGDPEVKENRKVETYKPLNPGDDLGEVLKLIKECYFLSMEF